MNGNPSSSSCERKILKISIVKIQVGSSNGFWLEYKTPVDDGGGSLLKKAQCHTHQSPWRCRVQWLDTLQGVGKFKITVFEENNRLCAEECHSFFTNEASFYK